MWGLRPHSMGYHHGSIGDRTCRLRVFRYEPIASPKPSVWRNRLLQIRICFRVAKLMISVRILESFNINNAFIRQSESRSPDLEIQLSNYVIHSFAKLRGEEVISCRPPPLPGYIIAACMNFVPERNVSVDKELKRLRWVSASIHTAFDYYSKE
jgi:hypothetical protein